jgi:hypothetical protein
MKFKGDVLITDPCYLIRESNQLTKDDWESCEYGLNMEVLDFKNYICRDTIYGDWSCKTFVSSKNEIGQFCADSGMVGVFLLDEVLKYNPDFDYHLNKPWTTTWIKDFDGNVVFVVNEQKEKVKIKGVGNINFYTKQTGF